MQREEIHVRKKANACTKNQVTQKGIERFNESRFKSFDGKVTRPTYQRLRKMCYLPIITVMLFTSLCATAIVGTLVACLNA